MSAAYEVQQGVPLPPGGQGGHNRIYPWEKLQAAGDSMLLPLRNGEDHDTARRRIYAAARFQGNKTGARYAVRVRRTKRDGEDGIRVWRTK